MIGDIRHHGDDRGFLMTYLAARGSVVEVFGFDVPTLAPPAIAPEHLGLRGIGVTACGAIEVAAGFSDVPDGVKVEILGDDV